MWTSEHREFGLCLLIVTMHRTTGSVILKLSHGYTTTKTGQDPLVQLADDALSEFSVAAQPGKWMVDMLPFRASFLYK